MSYVLVTNIFNEEERVPHLVENIANQTLRPVHWVWIDDGSTDRGAEVVKACANEHDISITLFAMPQKTRGNLDTIGKSWNAAHDFIRNHLKADYLSVVDVDTSLPANYYQDILHYMNTHQQVGVSSGIIRGQEDKNLVLPMGLGKVVRWEILLSFNRYWDLAPDSFLNIKAIALGFDLRILPILLNSAPMTIFSRKGRFRYGRRQYYVRKHPLMVLFESIKLQLTEGQGSEILRGYWVEWSRGSWKCQDTDIQFYYSLKRALYGVIGLKSSGWRKKRVIDASKNQN